MVIGVIPILVDSHSHSHVLFNSCPIPTGLPWDSHSHWDSQSHAHLYYRHRQSKLKAVYRLVTQSPRTDKYTNTVYYRSLPETLYETKNFFRDKVAHIKRCYIPISLFLIYENVEFFYVANNMRNILQTCVWLALFDCPSVTTTTTLGMSTRSPAAGVSIVVRT